MSIKETLLRTDELLSQISKARNEVNAMQSELDDANRRYRYLFDNLGDEVHLWKVIRNEQGEIQTWELVDVNPSALRVWNKSKEEVIGKTTNEIFGFDAAAQFLPTIKNIFETGKSVRWIQYFQPTDQYLSMASVPMGEYFISTGRDVTGERKVEKEIAESENRFKAVFHNSAVAKALIDTNGSFVEVNAQACDLLGYTKAQLEKMSVHDLPYFGDFSSVEQFNLLQETGVENGEFEITDRDGEIKVIEHFSRMISDGLYLTTLIDRTDKRTIEKRIRMAEERLRSTTNSVPGMIYQFQFNKDGTYSIPFVSERATELLGFSPEQMSDPEFLFSRIHPEDFEWTMNSVLEANEEDAFWSAEFRALDVNEEVVWLKGQSSGKKDEEGNIVHSGVFLDITAKKSAEEALQVSRQRYQNIAENLPGIVMRFKLMDNGDQEVLYISRGVTSLYNLSAEDVLVNNQLLWIRIHEEDKEGYRSSLLDSKIHLTTWNYEFRLHMPDGEIKWVYMKGIPEVQKDGSIIWDSIGLDITTQKSAEKELERINYNLEKLVQERTQRILEVSKERELYWLAAHHAQSGVWYLNLRNKVLEWDEIMYKLYGVNPADFSGAYDAWENSLHPEDRERAVEEFNYALKNHKELDTVFRIVHPKSGQISHIRSKGKIELDKDGKAVSIYGTNWDVTREMQLAEEREQALKNLKDTQSQLILSEKMASLGVLTAGIAHEINNPLNYITGGVAAIQDSLYSDKEFDKEEILEYLEWIRTGAERATNVVKSLNLFSRSNHKQDERCDLNLIVDNCLMVLHQKYKERIEIKRDYATSECIVNGNNGRIHQAILNLLSNAVDAIEGKGVITIRTRVLKNKVKCTIRDNGMGIAQEDIDKVLDPFFTTKDPGMGTGLGLSITKAIIDEHNGEIRCKSKVNEGTIFEFELPKNNNE